MAHQPIPKSSFDFKTQLFNNLNLPGRRKEKRHEYIKIDTSSSALVSDPNKIPRHGPINLDEIRWAQSPVVNPLAGDLLPRDERVPPNVARRVNLHIPMEPPRPLRSFRGPRRVQSQPGWGAKFSIDPIVEAEKHKSGAHSAGAAVESPSEMLVMEVKHLRLREELVNSCAVDLHAKREWGFYLSAYSDGRFNLSTPPETPPRDPSLLWIPSPFPRNEFERLQSLERYNISRANVIEADLRTVLRNASTALGAEFASISLVDYQSETFLLNHPIRIGIDGKVKRAFSIGAHIMLGNEAMVILDTRKDWRFHGNPVLGNGAKRVCFYAGSPLLSPDGYNIGVLAISASAPRARFSRSDLRSLSNFANVISTHLERLLPVDYRSPLSSGFDRYSGSSGSGYESDVLGTQLTASTAQTKVRDFALELQTDTRILTGSLGLEDHRRGLTKGKVNGGSALELSAERNVWKERKEKRRQARKESELRLTNGRPTSLETFKQTLNPSPTRPLTAGAIDHEKGLPMLPSLPSPPAATNVFAQKFGHRRQISSQTSLMTPVTPRTPFSPTFIAPHTPTTPSLPSSFFLPTPPSPPKFIPHHHQPLNLPVTTFSQPRNLPQAKLLISDIAKQIDFDYLYIIRLEPISPSISFSDLLLPSSYQIVMIHSYRRNPTPSGSANQALNTELHLKALRDPRGLNAVKEDGYANKRNAIYGGSGLGSTSSSGGNSPTNGDSYQVSVLLPVQKDFVDENGVVYGTDGCEEAGNERCTSSATGGESIHMGKRLSGERRVCRGHILGAYKRRNTGDHAVAIQRLELIANALGMLMFEATEEEEG